MSSDDYRGFRITTIHAITVIAGDDQEGVPAFITPMGPMPLIASDPARLADIKQMAQVMSDTTGKTFKIVKFSVREDIGEIKSRKLS